MAALLTSVIDNSKKVSEYILTCRNMGIELLPPDVNQGEAGFSVYGDSIRYALTAIKGVGHPVIESLARERSARGPFTNIKDFVTRMADKSLNKGTIENFIKAGALDSLGGTRKQFMSVYVQIVDNLAKDKKNNLAGQISLFDIADEEDKEEFDIQMPQVGEYSKEMLLAFEKEVLGIYVSGHPLEEYKELWERYITNNTNDFAMDEETGNVRVADKSIVVIGGMIADKTIKYTKNDKAMAFLNLEDLVGNIEVVVFPKDLERYGSLLVEDAKVFIKGKVSCEDDKDGKLLCEQIVSFDEAAQANGEKIFKSDYERGLRRAGQSGYGSRYSQMTRENTQSVTQPRKVPNGVWIQFANAQDYARRQQELLQVIADCDGNEDVVVFLKDTKVYNVLQPNLRVKADEEMKEKLSQVFGKENVKFVTKPIENR